MWISDILSHNQPIGIHYYVRKSMPMYVAFDAPHRFPYDILALHMAKPHCDQNLLIQVVIGGF